MIDTGDLHIMSVINVSFVKLVVSEGHTLLQGENIFFSYFLNVFFSSGQNILHWMSIK
jgi:hypothetical protein